MHTNTENYLIFYSNWRYLSTLEYLQSSGKGPKERNRGSHFSSPILKANNKEEAKQKRKIEAESKIHSAISLCIAEDALAVWVGRKFAFQMKFSTRPDRLVHKVTLANVSIHGGPTRATYPPVDGE